MSDQAFIIVPFARRGLTLAATDPIIVEQPNQVQAVANRIAEQALGVAVIRRDVDPDTGSTEDTLLATAGAVPVGFPAAGGWSVRLN